MHTSARVVALVALGIMVVSGVARAEPGASNEWSAAQRVEAAPPGADPSFNGPDLDGCPFIALDDTTFFMASNRSGGLGGIDIWVATRASADAPWGAPVNVGAPINSAANDFCPTPTRWGHEFYFVSNRDGGCGGDDIYVTRLELQEWSYGWGSPQNLGCQVNSAANEASPVPRVEQGGPVL